MKVCYVFLFETPHWGDSNEYTQYTIFNIKMKITPNYPKSAAMGIFSEGLKNNFETAVVNKPLGFEPLKFHRTQISLCIRAYWSVITFHFWGFLEDSDGGNVQADKNLPCPQVVWSLYIPHQADEWTYRDYWP